MGAWDSKADGSGNSVAARTVAEEGEEHTSPSGGRRVMGRIRACQEAVHAGMEGGEAWMSWCGNEKR